MVTSRQTPLATLFSCLHLSVSHSRGGESENVFIYRNFNDTDTHNTQAVSLAASCKWSTIESCNRPEAEQQQQQQHFKWQWWPEHTWPIVTQRAKERDKSGGQMMTITFLNNCRRAWVEWRDNKANGCTGSTLPRGHLITPSLFFFSISRCLWPCQATFSACLFFSLVTRLLNQLTCQCTICRGTSVTPENRWGFLQTTRLAPILLFSIREREREREW